MGKTAVITGAAGGFGKEFAKILAAEGYALVLAGRTRETLERLAEEMKKAYGVSVYTITADLSAEGEAQRLYEFALQADPAPEVLVNNAGFGDYGEFASCDPEKQTRMIGLNVRALTELTRLFLPEMKKQGRGRIINLASIASFEPGPMMSVYYASKAYVLSFSEALSEELRGSGVSVTALCPGPVNTGFNKAANVPSGRRSEVFRNKGPEAAAAYGWKMAKKGKAVAVPGLLVKAGVIAAKLSPRSWTRHIVYRMQKEK